MCAVYDPIAVKSLHVPETTHAATHSQVHVCVCGAHTIGYTSYVPHGPRTVFGGIYIDRTRTALSRLAHGHTTHLLSLRSRTLSRESVRVSCRLTRQT